MSGRAEETQGTNKPLTRGLSPQLDVSQPAYGSHVQRAKEVRGDVGWSQREMGSEQGQDRRFGGRRAALPYGQYMSSEEVGDGRTTSEYRQLIRTKVGTQERRLFAWL